MNVFLPSLPNMAAYFQVDYAVMQLSVALYLFASAVLQVIVGPLSDRYGRRRLLLASMILFALATVGTLVATNVEVFLICRTAQAVVATGMVLSRAIARDLVDEAQAASMLGYLTMGMAIVPMVGPVIGGMLDEAFGWKASFSVLLLAALLVLALTWVDLGETSVRRYASFGAQFREYPALFASPRFWGYVACASLTSGVFFAYLGGAPFVGSEIYGLSPSRLGLYFGITALGYILGNFLSGRYSVRVGVNPMILVGHDGDHLRPDRAGAADGGRTWRRPGFSSASSFRRASATAWCCPTPRRGCCRCARTLRARPPASAARS
jgi:MFS transporter, DHA1 family, multidrug resistance protein